MTREIASGIMLTLILVSMLTLAFDIPLAEAETAKLYVDPAVAFALPNETFAVDIKIADVVNLGGWGINMSFNPDVLAFVNVTEGDFLANQPEGTYGPRVHQGTGWAIFYVITLGAYPGVNGSGILATVGFEVKTIGESVLNITNELTQLAEMHIPTIPSDEPSYELIPYTAENGYFTNLAAALSSTLDIKPDTLNLESKGKRARRWITAYIELPGAYDVYDIDVSSIMLNATIPAVGHIEFSDHDSEGVLDLTVEFDRAEVQSYILDHISLRDLVKARFTTVRLILIGELTDGTFFRGSDTIKIIFPVERTQDNRQENVRFYIKNPSGGNNKYAGMPVGTIFPVQVWIDSPSEWYDTPDGIIAFTISIKVNPEILEPLRAVTVPDLDSDGWSDGFLGEFCQCKEWTIGMTDLPVGGIVNKTDGTINAFALGIPMFRDLGVGAGESGMLVWFEFKSKSATEYSPIDLIDEGLFNGISIDARYTNARGETYKADIVEDGHYNYPSK